MNHYLVFTARKFKNVMGVEGITWEIAGVYNASDQQRACLKAMQEKGAGTAFAVSGYAFGVDMEDASDVTELGKAIDPVTRLERMGAMLAEKFAAALPPAQVTELTEGDVENDG